MLLNRLALSVGYAMMCYLSLHIRGPEQSTVMEFPPPRISKSEKELDSKEVVKLGCFYQQQKELTSSFVGIVENEKYSFDEKFGYIYRFDFLVKQQDHILGTYLIRTTFVVWSHDCRSFMFVSYPEDEDSK